MGIVVYLVEKSYRNRFAQLTQAKLRKSLLNAERRTQKVKENFTSNVVHELRTPLHGLLGVLLFLKATKLDKNQSEFA